MQVGNLLIRLFKISLKNKKIVHFTTHNEKQANYVEHFIKTIKSWLYRYMTENNTSRYIDILPQIVDSYNKIWHSGIRSEPINVTKQMKRFYGGKCIGLNINM